MSLKVYLSPSNQDNNPYSYGGTNEMAQCNRIAEAAEKYLLRNGFEVKRAPAGQDMYKSISESNAYGADVHICMHTNAGGGHGCEVYTYSGAIRELKYAEPIYNEIAGITPYSDRGLKVVQFAELVQTTAIAVYCECAFHDNYDEAKWIVENVDNIGKAIAKGMCKAVGKTFIEGTPEPAPAPEPSGETVYTVQSGDTLWGIGQKYGVEYQVIADYNGITNPSLIYLGQKIKIPGTGTVTYTVQAGDTLTGIAAKYGTTYQKIAADNGIENPNLIHPGQVLKIL